MFGKTCPKCEFENSEDANFCRKCGNVLEKTIAHFKGNWELASPEIEITPKHLIVHERSKLTGRITGKIRVYEREKMENIEIGWTLSQLRFQYNGKMKVYNLQRKYLDKAEKILLAGEKQGELIELAKKWNVWIFGHRHDIRALPEILRDDEKVERMATGFYEGGTGVIVATDQRILFVDKGRLFGLRVEEFPYDAITSVRYKKGLFTGSIKIYSGGNEAKIENVLPNEIDAFKKILESKITQKAKGIDQITSPLDEIKKAKELLDMGAITKEEFKK
ncbi:MAG: PH domain-containing protein [Methanobacteriales archaeon]|nr:PH domain-containing protein [Methanobacteriales archaeon]